MRRSRKVRSPNRGGRRGSRSPRLPASLHGQHLHHVAVCTYFQLLVPVMLPVVMHGTGARPASPGMSSGRPVEHGRRLGLGSSRVPHGRLGGNCVRAPVTPQTPGADLVASALVSGAAGALLSHHLAEHVAQRLVHGLGELPLGVLQLHFEEAPSQTLPAGGVRARRRGRGARVPAAAGDRLGELLPQVELEAGVRLRLRHLRLRAGDLRRNRLHEAHHGLRSEGGAFFERQLRGERLDQAGEGSARRRRRARGEEAGPGGGAFPQGAGVRWGKRNVESVGMQPPVVLNRRLPLPGERDGGVVVIVVEGEDELAVVQAVPFALSASQLDHNPSGEMPLGAGERREANSRAVGLRERSATSPPSVSILASSVPVCSTLRHYLDFTSHSRGTWEPGERE